MTAEFTYYFRSLVAALGERPNWYAVFAEREPETARAHASGREVPPWDVVRTVLHDAAVNAGAAEADPAEAGRGYALYRAAVAAEDAAPGAAAVLRDRLHTANRARESAAARTREAARAWEGGAEGPSAARLANALAWARDDLARASARCEELRERFAAVAGAGRLGWKLTDDPGPAAPGPTGARFAGGATHQNAGPGPRGARFAGGAAYDSAEAVVEPAAPRPRGARFAGGGPKEPVEPVAPRPRGARFAGSAPSAPAEAAAPRPPAPPRGRTSAPRGARFAGAPDTATDSAPPPPPQAAAAAPRGARFAGAAQQAAPEQPRTADPRWTAEAKVVAGRLGQLRRTGESGAAYLVLCSAAEGPAERLPYVVTELESTGLGADVATLLWEIAALPPDRVAGAVAALAADDRAEHGRTLLHQAASRAPADVAVIADLLHGAGRTGEAGELLETLARARPAATAAAVARSRPALTTPLLRAAARVSPPCHRDIAAALNAAF